MLRKSVVLLILLLYIPLFSENLKTFNNVKLQLPGDEIKFLKEFSVTYVFPEKTQILNAAATNYDFSDTSLLMQVGSIASNYLTVKIRTFEISNFNIPPVTVTIMNENKTNTGLTPFFPLNQKTFDTLISNTAPIEEIFNIYDFNSLIIILFVILILAAGIFIFIRYIQGKGFKQAKTVDNMITLQNPYDEAITSLNLLMNSKEPENRIIFEKTQTILRSFISRVYEIPAQEMDSSEIRSFFSKKIKVQPKLSESAILIRDAFKICDRIKYAKELPTNSQKDRVLTYGFDIVHKTRDVLSPPPDAPEKPEGPVL